MNKEDLIANYRKNKALAEELYKQVQNAYGPIYYPTSDEIAQAVEVLISELKRNPDIGKTIIHKAKFLGSVHGDHKTKVSVLVMNKFWESDFGYGIQANKYIDED